MNISPIIYLMKETDATSFEDNNTVCCSIGIISVTYEHLAN